MAPQQKNFFASVEDLREMLSWVRVCLMTTRLNPKQLRRIEIATEEALVNIIRHAYKEDGGEIRLLIEIKADQLQIQIEDHGPAFNPLKEKPIYDPTLPLEERAEGGLGIMLITKYMDTVSYKRLKGWNQLTLMKRLP